MKMTNEELYENLSRKIDTSFVEIGKVRTDLSKEIRLLNRELHYEVERLDTRITKQFKYFDDKFAAVDRRFDTVATKEQLDSLLVKMDTYLARSEDQELETGALALQVDRHERWIRKAQKRGLSPA